MDVGEKLKEARLAKDISLDSLQEKTKIQKRYLVAIEEGNFNILPGKFYTRAFIKEYASAVGINPDELMTDHKEELPPTEEEENVQYSRIQRTRKESRSDKESRSSSIIPTVTVILLIIAIIAVAIFFLRQSSSSNEGEPVEDNNTDSSTIITDSDENNNDNGNDAAADDSEENNNDEENEDEEQEADENEEVSVEVVEEGTGSSPTSVLELSNVSDEAVLTLESADSELNSWLDVTGGDDESLFSGNFDAEASPLEIDISGEDSVLLNIGNSSAVTISVDGTDIEYPTSAIHQRLELQIGN
ncbi:helix-turn-helix domain-containing protein [Oceanobacillus neutriphilus]|uniref:Transcriptional regulator n=1 Tax=Oceanobacillus neutriphilus TaxID=531815 RepID=A0ABQ2NWM9_9BACI|nr:helix-turn-helix domain-containing protein [Oceanobacillus neutriphilus]GGP12491.1 transcriptional regulator [Oceanobacillus neutriphilus]